MFYTFIHNIDFECDPIIIYETETIIWSSLSGISLNNYKEFQESVIESIFYFKKNYILISNDAFQTGMEYFNKISESLYNYLLSLGKTQVMLMHKNWGIPNEYCIELFKNNENFRKYILNKMVVI